MYQSFKTTANTIWCLNTARTKYTFSLKIAGEDVHIYGLLPPVETDHSQDSNTFIFLVNTKKKSNMAYYI